MLAHRPRPVAWYVFAVGLVITIVAGFATGISALWPVGVVLSIAAAALLSWKWGEHPFTRGGPPEL